MLDSPGLSSFLWQCCIGGYTCALKEVKVKSSDDADLVRKVREYDQRTH
jgi:hypothetical protein